MAEAETPAPTEQEELLASLADLAASGDEGSPSDEANPETAPSKRDDLEQVLKSLEAEPDRESCLEGLRTLEAATLKSSSCHQRILKAEGAKVLVALMALYLQDSEVQIVASNILQHLASSATADGAVLIAQAGGCAAACSAMDSHPEVAAVQQAACHAVELIAFAGPELRAQVLADGCAEAVIQALKKFRGNSAVTQACLAALQPLAEDKECQARLEKVGGMAAIISALADTKENAQVMYWGQIVMEGMCAGNSELRQEAIRKCHFQKIELEWG
eukprot:TRINITY_DN31049_c0_g1_i1.p1 TRINITY_DN31049_c0_g1~~TRINITY_DN31049_c0_g1_i1.p1  ORF type:complete len:297 (-),score=88.05 TRINITY_DN31049_c0_g1_i1:89-913(-)